MVALRINGRLLFAVLCTGWLVGAKPSDQVTVSDATSGIVAQLRSANLYTLDFVVNCGCSALRSLVNVTRSSSVMLLRLGACDRERVSACFSGGPPVSIIYSCNDITLRKDARVVGIALECSEHEYPRLASNIWSGSLGCVTTVAVSWSGTWFIPPRVDSQYARRNKHHLTQRMQQKGFRPVFEDEDVLLFARTMEAPSVVTVASPPVPASSLLIKLRIKIPHLAENRAKKWEGVRALLAVDKGRAVEMISLTKKLQKLVRTGGGVDTGVAVQVDVGGCGSIVDIDIKYLDAAGQKIWSNTHLKALAFSPDPAACRTAHPDGEVWGGGESEVSGSTLWEENDVLVDYARWHQRAIASIQSSNQNTPRILVYRAPPFAGFGNILQALSSALLYSIATRRVLLVDWQGATPFLMPPLEWDYRAIWTELGAALRDPEVFVIQRTSPRDMWRVLCNSISSAQIIFVVSDLSWISMTSVRVQETMSHLLPENAFSLALRWLFRPTSIVLKEAHAWLSRLRTLKYVSIFVRTDSIPLYDSGLKLWDGAAWEEHPRSALQCAAYSAVTHNATGVFVLSDAALQLDSMPTKGQFQLFIAEPADRFSIQGRVSAVAELYVAAMGSAIVATCGSTFGTIAAALLGAPPYVLQKDGTCSRDLHSQPCFDGWDLLRGSTCYNPVHFKAAARRCAVAGPPVYRTG